MRFSILAVATALVSGAFVAAGRPLTGWHIINEDAIKPFYHIEGDTWVEKKDIVDRLKDAAGEKHDNSDKKKPKDRGGYPHVYTNDKGPWPKIEGSSMEHGMYFEFQLGKGQRTPADARVVYTIKGDPNEKEKNAGEKKPIETKFVGIMKHGEKNGPFIIVDGQDKKDDDKKDDDKKDDDKKDDDKKDDDKKDDDKKDDDKKDDDKKDDDKKDDDKKDDDKKDDDKKDDDKKDGKDGKAKRAARYVKRSYPIHFQA